MSTCLTSDPTAGIPAAVDETVLRTPCEMVPIIEAAIQILIGQGGQGRVTSVSYNGRSTTFDAPMGLTQLRRMKEHYQVECRATGGGDGPLTGPLAKRRNGRLVCLGGL